ncbi:hypothetical protein [Sulfurospirillum sp. 1612]|uniref:hypothetical protein n=1 Tax=Sulfurospirillum sp. 1612 TaxID=3094835 RepID=UPI002F94433A
MRYSFTKPHPKPLVSLFTKIWIIFILFVSFILITFGLFLLFQIHSYKKETKVEHAQRIVLESKVSQMDQNIEYLLRQKAQGEEIYSRNTLLKDSIKNLFDLVPDQITLKRVVIKKDSLIIYGKTPTKDTYNFLLAAPLKSIFSTNSTMFYLTKNGWYNFISTNKITQTDGFSE